MNEIFRNRALQRLKDLLCDTDSCIIYPHTSSGYGSFQYAETEGIGHTHILMHRLCYEFIHNIRLVPEQIICHTCDTPACINPRHLFLGTHEDNVADKVSKNRQAKGKTNGRYTLGYYSKYDPKEKPKTPF